MDIPSEREKKMSKCNKHFQIYLDYLEKHNVLRLNWSVQRSYVVELQNIWQDMARELNECGGPVRDVSHWKKVFTEWKSHTRRKLKCNKQLNEFEQHLAELTSLANNPGASKKLSVPAVEQNILEAEEQKSSSDEIKIEIKQEVEDPTESTDASSVDKQPIKPPTRGCPRLIISEKPPTQPINIIRRSAEVHVQHQVPIADETKPLLLSNAIPGTRTSNVSTQISEDGNNLASVGLALQNLANAVNRYCDIVERRIF